MSHLYTRIDRLGPLPPVLLTVVLLAGCGAGDSPLGPTATGRNRRATPLLLSGHVYQQPSSVGEPAVSNALITVRDASGAENTARTDHHGFYCIEAAPGELVVSAAKEGYGTRESRFAITESTVLNFGLEPLQP